MQYYNPTTNANSTNSWKFGFAQYCKCCVNNFLNADMCDTNVSLLPTNYEAVH